MGFIVRVEATNMTFFGTRAQVHCSGAVKLESKGNPNG